MENEKQIIYLDNNATTQVDKRVLDAMMPYLTTSYANANSTHQFGIEAYEAVKNARLQVSQLIGAEPHEIIFTSGSTEAINLAIKGVAESYSSKGKHIITITTEHPAVLDTCKYLEINGFEVTYLPVKSDGLIDIKLLKSVLRNDTILLSVMMANNETGVCQPIDELSEIAHSVGALFMTDATQAVGKIPTSVDDLGIDLLSLSGHKLYGPKGVGALFVRQRINRVKISAIIHGGGHERGLRSGTLNVPGIVALGTACYWAQREMERNMVNILAMRDYLETELLRIDGTSINGDIKNRLFNTSNILFRGADSDAIILGLSNPENNLPLIAVSNGSACSSASIDPSHVLTAMGLNEKDAYCCIRFSLGKFNTKMEIEIAVDVVKNVINGLRSMAT